MSSLTLAERTALEKYLGMSGGFVLNFSDRTFGEFVVEAIGININDDKYCIDGSSKARRLRAFWKIEKDYVVGQLLLAILDSENASNTPRDVASVLLGPKCRQIAVRLHSGGPNLDSLKSHAQSLDARYLREQIQRMEAAVKADPSLAIGTAKELIETCCKTILTERGKTVGASDDIPTLTKATFKELKLVPDAIPEASRGADVIKRLLSNLGTIGNGLAELRGLYGTGHGKHAQTGGLSPRHAKLAVGAAATLVVFLFETHQESKK